MNAQVMIVFNVTVILISFQLQLIFEVRLLAYLSHFANENTESQRS